MIRKAFGLGVALAFLASFAPPLCVAAAPAPSHACCGGPSKKAPAGPSGSCCRQALPSTAKPIVSVPALAHTAPVLASVSVVVALTSDANIFVLDSAPPGPTGRAPPTRVS
jgi:hypothetical protein